MNQIINNNILQWQPVKRTMTYQDFVKIFPRSERIKHCNFNEIKKDEGHEHAKCKQKNNFGQILGPCSQAQAAVKNLKKFILDRYNIELIGQQTKAVQLCHLCTHNSQINKKDSNKHTCITSTHVYFGTAQENNLDRDPNDRKKGLISQINIGANPTQVKNKCPYCDFETTQCVLGLHIPSCHFNPTSYNYLKPILHHNKKKEKYYQNKGLGHKLIELDLMIAENYNSRHQ